MTPSEVDWPPGHEPLGLVHGVRHDLLDRRQGIDQADDLAGGEHPASVRVFAAMTSWFQVRSVPAAPIEGTTTTP